MMRFYEKSSYKALGIRAMFVIVPPELESAAYALVTVAYGAYNQVPTLLQKQGIQVVVVPGWSDATDYTVIANPADCLGYELGFLDGNETPDIFVSDLPNAGSFFTNDSVTYKIRHIYGGNVTDFRAFYGQTCS
jgi:hypothetical protein